ncbi:MAG: hypothetical protein PUB11_05585, partial [Oscillospiraceae bacterium]|nr:hypothetical protein [Oscillospiraceae bacterium]
MENESSVSSKSLLFSIVKYSIATIINALIYGVSLLCVSWFVDPDVYGQVDIFASTTTLIMNICILGMDQSFIRFFNEPPKPLDKNSLFGACFGFSSVVLLITCLISCIFFPQRVLGIFFADELATKYLWMLFANAFFSMIGRYINILYRMDGKIVLYTVESVANQFFTKLFFLFGTAVKRDFDTLVLFMLIGMGGFALVFLFLNIKRISISPKILFSEANKQLLPYGLALAPTAIMLWLNSLFSKVYISKTIGKGPAGVFSMVSTLAN